MKELPERKNIRLRNYNYSQTGMYFVTICCKNKEHLLGTVVGTDALVRPPYVELSEEGKIVENCIQTAGQIYSNVNVDSYVVMPNHTHVIFEFYTPDSTDGRGRPSLHQVVQGIKSVSTRKCRKYGHITIWQERFYDHIIRGEQDYMQIREYIDNNPARWVKDAYYA